LEATPPRSVFTDHTISFEISLPSKFPNYSIYFLPERPTFSDVAPYLRELPFKLPEDIKSALSVVDWDKMPFYEETPHHALQRKIRRSERSAYSSQRQTKFMSNLEKEKIFCFFMKNISGTM
jgi:hypothetical protein